MGSKKGKEIRENFMIGLITNGWVALVVILIVMSE